MKASDDFELSLPASSRKQKTTQRLRHTDAPEGSVHVVEFNFPQLSHREYLEAVDIVMQELDRQFDQHDLEIAVRREKILLNSVSQNTSNHIQDTGLDNLLLPPIIDKERLSLKLSLLRDLCSDKRHLQTAIDLSNLIASLQPETRQMFVEVEHLICLCIALPISIASSERSFS